MLYTVLCEKSTFFVCSLFVPHMSTVVLLILIIVDLGKEGRTKLVHGDS